LGFLVSGRTAAENLIYRYWIRLDFLGFSRQNRELSMVTQQKRVKNFLARLSVAAGEGNGDSTVEAERA
jgi:hypothetical protein